MKESALVKSHMHVNCFLFFFTKNLAKETSYCKVKEDGRGRKVSISAARG